MKKRPILKLTLSAVFLAVGMILPLFTSQIKEIGDTLLPMHLPVLLCGFICGAGYGGTVGLLLPFLRSIIFGMPALYPNAVWMAAELAAYGITAGLLYSPKKRHGLGRLYLSLVISMLAGRAVWGITKASLLGMSGKAFTFAAFISGGFTDAFPGIIIQLLVVPLLVRAAERTLPKL